MKILVIGRGGREHAIVHKVSESQKVNNIFVAPGNVGMENLATRIDIDETNVSELLKFAKEENIDLTIVGPEAALVVGIVDKFQEEGLMIFGPTQKAARIESSKVYAKQIMNKKNVPTGKSKLFDNAEKAIEYIKQEGAPIVVKYDGLAAGKGVVVAMTNKEAIDAVNDMISNQKFGEDSVLIEEFLEGPEFSLMALVSGEKVYPLQIAQDHKRAYDGDKGPNTGGMGAYSDVPFITEEIIEESLNKIMLPVAKGLVEDNNSFTGVLYGGIISTKQGPKVIEFNARFGDPETEVVLPRLESDLIDIIIDILNKNEPNINWIKEKTVGVVLASKGYPEKYEKNIEIKGLENVNTQVYHMGTNKINDKIVNNGGRVLFVVGKGNTIEEAQINAYKEVEKIECDNLFYRKDIAYQAIKK